MSQYKVWRSWAAQAIILLSTVRAANPPPHSAATEQMGRPDLKVGILPFLDKSVQLCPRAAPAAATDPRQQPHDASGWNTGRRVVVQVKLPVLRGAPPGCPRCCQQQRWCTKAQEQATCDMVCIRMKQLTHTRDRLASRCQPQKTACTTRQGGRHMDACRVRGL